MMECERLATFAQVSAVSHRCTYVAKELLGCVCFAATLEQQLNQRATSCAHRAILVYDTAFPWVSSLPLSLVRPSAGLE